MQAIYPTAHTFAGHTDLVRENEVGGGERAETYGALGTGPVVGVPPESDLLVEHQDLLRTARAGAHPLAARCHTGVRGMGTQGPGN